MKTDELVAMLAAGAGAQPAHVPARRLAFALAGGTLVSALLMLVFLGARASLVEDIGRPMLWVKFGFIVALACGGLLAVSRLSTPGRSLGHVLEAMAAPVLLLWLLAVVVLLAAEPQDRLALTLGQTWRYCGYRIAGLAAPLLVTILWALRGLAPTRLRLAGAAAGLLAGALGALVYAFHCPELAAPFLGLWYVIGMSVPAVLGALIGPSVLRW